MRDEKGRFIKNHPQLNSGRTHFKKGMIVSQERREELRELVIQRKSVVREVTWVKRINRWLTQIQVDRKNIYLGYYSDIKEAIQIRRLAEERYHA